MRPLIIDQKMKFELVALKEHAISNPVTAEMIFKADSKPIGDNPDYVLDLLFGYRVVLSLEKQPMGDVFHASFSVPTAGKLPSQFVVAELMGAMGFGNNMTDFINVAIEDIDPNHQAVNVWAKK